MVIGVIQIALLASGHHLGLQDMMWPVLMQVLIQGGIITAIFAMVNIDLRKYPDRWNPRRPGHLEVQLAADERVRCESRVSRVESIAQLIALAVSVAWLQAVHGSMHTIFGPAASVLTFSPAWRQVYWPVILIALAGMIQSAINLFHPRWVRLRTWTRIGMNAASLAIVYFLAHAHIWMMLNVSDGVEVSDHQHGVAIVNRSILGGLSVAAVILIVLLVLDVQRLLQEKRREQSSS
jgi:magnesium-transporting ATPase (P-type)